MSKAENWELLERFLPGYRLVCRLFARYLSIDLTNTATVLFVLFALLKAARYVFDNTSNLLSSWLISSIVVCEDAGEVYWELMRWVEDSVITGRRGAVNAKSLRVGGARSGRASKHHSNSESEKSEMRVERWQQQRLCFEPDFDSTVWIWTDNFTVIFLRRKRALDRDKALYGEFIELSCIGLTTRPLRRFLEESVLQIGGASPKKKANGTVE